MIRSRPTVPVAADALLAPVLGGPRRCAEVVVVTPLAVYARTGDGLVVGLLAPAAVRVPGSLVVPGPAAMVSRGSRIVLGEGGLDVDGRRLVARRWWDSRVPRVGPPTANPTASALPVALPAAELEAALLGDAAVERAVVGLVGLGPGLTPAGDDLLAGALVALAVARADAVLARLSAAVRPLTHRTTIVSAALLAHAADGRAAPQLARYVTGLARGRLDTGVVQDLERVGATSGAALAAGARIGLRVAATLRDRARGRAEVA